MKEFHDRRRIKRLLHSRYAIGFLLILIVLLVRGVWGVYGKYERSKHMVVRAESDLSALKEREKNLSLAVESLETEAGRERELRDRFGVVREGERLVVLVEDGKEDEVVAAQSKPGFFRRFLDAIGF